MAGAADRQRDRRSVANRDRLLPRFERCAAVRGQIPAGIVRIELFDEKVRDVAGRRRKTPGDPVVVADHDQRHARGRAAGDFALRRPEPREIPDPGSGKSEMRVVGQQRLAARAVRAVDDPVVRGIGRADFRGEAGIERIERQMFGRSPPAPPRWSAPPSGSSGRERRAARATGCARAGPAATRRGSFRSAPDPSPCPRQGCRPAAISPAQSAAIGTPAAARRDASRETH